MTRELWCTAERTDGLGIAQCWLGITSLMLTGGTELSYAEWLTTRKRCGCAA